MDQTNPIHYYASANLPTAHGMFVIHSFTEETAQGLKEHDALVLGTPRDGCLVRVHSSCRTGEVHGSTRCDCAWQLERAKQTIADEGVGIIIYLHQDGRGIGHCNKIMAYALQDCCGADTAKANLCLGFPEDMRTYDAAAHILRHLNVQAFRLLTNNPKKIGELGTFGFYVVPVRICAPITPDNAAYLRTKQEKMGHLYALEER